MPDLTAQVLVAIGQVRGRESRPSALRLGLAAVAVVQLVASLPALILGDDAGLPVHAARHLGSFGVALAIGFLVAAWKPNRVAGVLPVVAALVVCLVATSALDVAAGRTAALGEIGHSTELVGVVLLWLMARTSPSPRVAPA